MSLVTRRIYGILPFKAVIIKLIVQMLYFPIAFLLIIVKIGSRFTYQ